MRDALGGPKGGIEFLNWLRRADGIHGQPAALIPTQAGQELGRKPIVVCFSRCECEPNRQTAAIDNRMYLVVRPPRDRPMDCFLLCPMQAAC
jgi:hypothetical protein